MRQARCYSDAVNHWIMTAYYGDEPYLNDKGHYGGRIFTIGDSIYSYGTHFEMGRMLRAHPSRKNRGDVVAVLLNGDRYGATTNKHQGLVRDAVRKLSVPSVIIPHQALASAGIDLDSVRILHVVPDREIVKHHVSDRPRPGVAFFHDAPVYETREYDEHERMLWRDWQHAHNNEMHIDECTRKLGYAWETAAKGGTGWGGHSLTEFDIESYLRWCKPESIHYHMVPSSYSVEVDRFTGYAWKETHWLRSRDDKGGYGVNVPVPGKEVFPDPDGKWRWTTSRHVLGESLIMADVKGRRLIKCRTCKGTGAVDREGYARRAPQMAKQWYMPHLGWYPQREDYSVYACALCHGNGKVWQSHKRRNVKFLSGFDHNETHLAYFLCELPKCDATTVDEAYEALKPDVVKLAEQMNRRVERQGDVFFVETTETTRSLGKRAKTKGRGLLLLGTNHKATEVVITKDDRVYARGHATHVPDGRSNDHKRIRLGDGKQWHLVVRNTVPTN